MKPSRTALVLASAMAIIGCGMRESDHPVGSDEDGSSGAELGRDGASSVPFDDATTSVALDDGATSAVPDAPVTDAGRIEDASDDSTTVADASNLVDAASDAGSDSAPYPLVCGGQTCAPFVPSGIVCCAVQGGSDYCTDFETCSDAGGAALICDDHEQCNVSFPDGAATHGSCCGLTSFLAGGYQSDCIGTPSCSGMLAYCQPGGTPCAIGSTCTPLSAVPGFYACQ